MRVPVRLIPDSGEPVLGQTENISISGAFVQTACHVPLWARLEVELVVAGELGQEPERVAAHVTRRTRHGVGLEWYELAPRPVRALLLANDPPAGRPAHAGTPRGVRSGRELQTGSLAAPSARLEMTGIAE